MKKISFYFSLIFVIMIACVGAGCSLFASKHIVIYDYNGGIGEITKEEVRDGKTLNLPQPTKEGYNFVGWYYNNSLWTNSSAVNGSMELEARWSAKNYTITFIVDGVACNESQPYDSTPVFHGELKKDSTNAFSYVFDGWEPSLTKIKGNATYTAKFKEIKNKFNLSLQSQNINAGTVTGTGSYEYGSNATIKAYAKTGYEFAGWYKNGVLYSSQSSLNVSITENISLTAKFNKLTRKINYYNTKSAKNNNKTSYDITMNDFELIDLQLTGYKFNGWYNQQTGGSKITIIDVSNFVDINLYARWTPINYSINYNLDGGNISISNPTTYNIESASIILKNPSKVGYTFTGWTGSNGTTPEMSVAISKGSIGNKTYKANWSEITYSIGYTLNGGTLATANPTTYNIESASIILNNPSKTGYTFTGWTGTGLSGKQTTVTIPTGSTGNRTYTANWTNEDYSIEYNLNGGVVSVSNPSLYNQESESITLNNPTREGYTFTGWTGTGLSGKQTTVTIPTGSTGNRTYTANWSAIIYTISCNLDGGILATANPTNYNIESASIILNNPSKTGYTFAGWSGTGLSGKTKTVIISTGSTGNRTYTANWTRITYSITYNLNGGTFESSRISGYTIESENLTLINPIKTGYTFAGWTGTGLSGKQTTVTIPTGSTGNRTYIANWKAITYSISYTLNGGTLASANPTTYNIESASITLNNPSKTGYTFTGWTGSNGITPELSVTILKGSIGNKTYTANWQEQESQNETSTINFMIDGIDFSNLTIAKEVGSIVTAPTLNAMTGYTFNGWYSDSGYKTKYTFNTMPATDITLYGSWKYLLDEGFYPYLEKFKKANTSSYLDINSYEELVAYYEYVNFYEITAKNKIKLTYTSLSSSTALFDEYKKAGVDCVYTRTSTTSYTYYSTSCGSIYIGTSRRSTDCTLIADTEKAYTYNQLDSSYLLVNKSKREETFNNFKINNVTKTLSVETSNQLVYALAKGLKPEIVSGSKAENIYNKAKEVVREICNDSMSDFEKVRAIYEWLVMNVEYDKYAADNLTGDWTKYDAWYAEGVFNNGVAVCDGISKAFIIMAKIENIPCIRVVSESHAWNKVYINNVWYGVDATHGNVLISNYKYELLTYTNFLFTDEYKESKGYAALNYLDVEATTEFNYYDYFNYIYEQSTFDLLIDNNEEFALVLSYISGFSTTDDYYTVEISINFTTTIQNLVRYGEGASGLDVKLWSNIDDNIYILLIK